MLDETTTGRALQRLRELSGLSERAAARQCGVRPSVLRSWETRRSMPDADQIARAVAVYGRDLGDAIPPRSPLTDPTRPGVLVVGEEEIDVADHIVAGSSTHQDNNAVICAYLAAVRRQRGLEDTDSVDLRAEDLAALAVELDLGDADLQHLLAALLDLTPAGAQLTMRTLLVGALVALLATGVVHGSWLAPTASASEPLLPAIRAEQVDQQLPTFYAGEWGPTARGPVFADLARADQAGTVTDATIVAGPTFSPGVQLTPDPVPYSVFSVDPPVEIGTATTLERGIGDGSEVFSVAPRVTSGGVETEIAGGSVTSVSATPALAVGAPEQQLGD